MCHVSPVTCKMSDVTCQMSPVRCHLSPVICPGVTVWVLLLILKAFVVQFWVVMGFIFHFVDTKFVTLPIKTCCIDGGKYILINTIDTVNIHAILAHQMFPYKMAASPWATLEYHQSLPLDPTGRWIFLCFRRPPREVIIWQPESDKSPQGIWRIPDLKCCLKYRTSIHRKNLD